MLSNLFLNQAPEFKFSAIQTNNKLSSFQNKPKQDEKLTDQHAHLNLDFLNEDDSTDEFNSNTSSLKSLKISNQQIDCQNNQTNKADSFEEGNPHWTEWCANNENANTNEPYQCSDIYNLLGQENNTWKPSFEKQSKSVEKTNQQQYFTKQSSLNINSCFQMNSPDNTSKFEPQMFSQSLNEKISSPLYSTSAFERNIIQSSSIDQLSALQSSGNQAQDALYNNSPLLTSSNIVDQLLSSSKIKSKESTSSPVLYVRGAFNVNSINFQKFYVIFNMFGNVKLIVGLKKKNALLIEYINAQHAAIAKEYLNNVPYAGGKFKIFFSNFQTLQTRNNFTDDIYFYGNQNDYRYKENIDANNINPPSQIIHVSNVQQFLDNNLKNVILKLFQQQGNIQNVKFYFKNNQNMILIKYASLQESFDAMSLHGVNLYGKKIKLSFTKAKI